jgi:hypothetical protein
VGLPTEATVRVDLATELAGISGVGITRGPVHCWPKWMAGQGSTAVKVRVVCKISTYSPLNR